MDATPGGFGGFDSSSSRASAGVCQPRVLRGRRLSLRGDVVEVVGLVDRQVGALGEVLAQQPVGVLVGAALPGRVGVAEVDVQAGGGGDLRRGWPSRCPGPRSGSGAASRAAGSSPSTMASATASAPCPSGRCSSITNRVARSTRVPIAEFDAVEPMIRSPSQCPGTARSATSAGRSLMLTMSGIRPRRSTVDAAGLADRPPGPQPFVQVTAQLAAALDVQGLVDRLVGHPHLRIVGEVDPQPCRDLLGRQLILEHHLHRGVKPRARSQLPAPHPPGTSVGSQLGRAGPILRTAVGKQGRPGPEFSADGGAMTPHHPGDLCVGHVGGMEHRDLFTLLETQTRPESRRRIAWGHHPTTLAVPIHPREPRRANPLRRLRDRQPLANKTPELRRTDAETPADAITTPPQSRGVASSP